MNPSQFKLKLSYDRILPWLKLLSPIVCFPEHPRGAWLHTFLQRKAPTTPVTRKNAEHKPLRYIVCIQNAHEGTGYIYVRRNRYFLSDVHMTIYTLRHVNVVERCHLGGVPVGRRQSIAYFGTDVLGNKDRPQVIIYSGEVMLIISKTVPASHERSRYPGQNPTFEHFALTV